MAKLCQYLAWPFIYLLSKVFLRVSIESQTDLAKLRGPLIIAANHISFYDSFLLRLWVGKHHHLLPIRFMGVTRFKARWLRLLNFAGVIKCIYKIFGVFEVFPGAGLEKNLEVPKKILSDGGVVLIYPEGSINEGSELLPFKKGVGALAVMTGVPVLVLVFKRERGIRPLIEISFSRPIAIEGSSYEEATAVIENTIKRMIGERAPISLGSNIPYALRAKGDKMK